MSFVHVSCTQCVLSAASGLFMVFLWVTGLQPVPKLDGGFIKALLPVALFHTIGHVSACVSFSQMAVSFAHIVKAAEPVRDHAYTEKHQPHRTAEQCTASPYAHRTVCVRYPCVVQVFSVALSGPLLGVTYPAYVWLSLLPIVAGCAMSAMKEVRTHTHTHTHIHTHQASRAGRSTTGFRAREAHVRRHAAPCWLLTALCVPCVCPQVSFAWSGFNNAMISNLGMVLRNIYSKKSLVKYKVNGCGICVSRG